MKNIEVTTWKGEGIAIDFSNRIEIRDSFIHGATSFCTDGGPVEIGRRAVEDVLFENNVLTDMGGAL